MASRSKKKKAIQLGNAPILRPHSQTAPREARCRIGAQATTQIRAPEYKGSGKLEGKVPSSPAAIPASAARSRCSSPRRRRRRDRLPRTSTRMRRRPSGRSRTKAERCLLLAGRRHGLGVLQGAPSRRRWRNSAGSTSWSTTRPSSSTSDALEDLTEEQLRRRPSRPTSTATSTWRRPRVPHLKNGRARSSRPARSRACSGQQGSCSTTR